nr:MAG TPA: hypothetical protein [Microviridae sp.]
MVVMINRDCKPLFIIFLKVDWNKKGLLYIKPL